MFYISSLGHSATAWLASILSEHPDLVCFHGTRSIPPYESGTFDMNPSEFVDGLIQLEKKCRHKKQFGACHGFYGSILKKDIESKGGKYMAIVRHPVKRIQSMFESKLLSYLLRKKNINGISKINLDFYKKLIDDETLRYAEQSIIFNLDFYVHNSKTKSHNISQVNRVKKKLFKKYIKLNHKFLNFKYESSELIDIVGYKSKKIVPLLIIDFFFELCNSVLIFDLENFNECSESQLLVMEEMTTSKEYFADKILSNLVNYPDQNFLIDDFQTKEVYNKHSRISELDPQSTYENWPHIFKHIYNIALTKFEIKENYISLGYKM